MKIDTEHKEGAPWKIVRRFSSFEEADATRSEILLENAGLQVKIHFMPGCAPRSDKYYAVKTRPDPALWKPINTKKKKKSKKKKRKK